MTIAKTIAQQDYILPCFTKCCHFCRVWHQVLHAPSPESFFAFASKVTAMHATHCLLSHRSKIQKYINIAHSCCHSQWNGHMVHVFDDTWKKWKYETIWIWYEVKKYSIAKHPHGEFNDPGDIENNENNALEPVFACCTHWAMFHTQFILLTEFVWVLKYIQFTF